jgi:hypothetical protein
VICDSSSTDETLGVLATAESRGALIRWLDSDDAY